jgi:Ca-activated chloride channel family protein
MLFRRRPGKHDVLRFSDAGLLQELKMNPLPVWRRRLLLLGVIVSLVLMIITAADPQRVGSVRSSRSTVVLALDVSRSMVAKDVSPTRFEAAKEAAIEFINAAPEEVDVGVVGFAASAYVIALPGTPREDIIKSLDGIILENGTAVGEAIFTSLSMLDTNGWTSDPDNPERSIQKRSGAIVLMSDGASNTGRPDVDAAAAAALAEVKVFTVAFGTAEGFIFEEDGAILEVPVEPESLQEVSSSTEAESYTAATGEELGKVFSTLARTAAVSRGWRSVAHWFALTAVVVLFITALGWVRFGSRI